MPNFFICRGIFYCFTNFGYRKKNYVSEGYVSSFCRDFCCLTQPKNFLRVPFCAVFQIISGSEKVYGCERVEIKIFRIDFVSKCGKGSFRRGIL